ncbi:MAG: hypothetical protein RIQ93_2299, partial [Verrucomicrobiota bacterium]
MFPQMGHGLRGKRTHFLIAGFRGRLLEELYVFFVFVDHVLDEFPVEFTAGLLAQALVCAVLAFVFVDLNILGRGNLFEFRIGLLVVLQKFLRKAAHFLVRGAFG